MRKLKMGMVGGGSDAFIGAVHRSAAVLDGGTEFVAGALSSTPEKAKFSGRALGLAEGRNYGSWEEMLEGELSLPEQERVDFVSVATPNFVHFPVAHAFVEAGFNVVCDKPMVVDSGQARRLVDAVEKTGVVFAVTYNYTGYPMVKQARHMVREGHLGEVRKVIVEYSQGWLATNMEENGNKQAEWRTDPERSGVAGAVGDIGSHAENLAHTVTGLEIAEISADLNAFVPGRRLDDDASVLIRYKSGARGVLICSQISTGEENNLSIRVYGSVAGLEWRQENPIELLFKPAAAPAQVLRAGNDYLCEEAKNASRLPPGHPEAFIEAFANVYAGVAEEIRIRKGERDPRGTQTGFPTVHDGARGVHFIEKAVESARSDRRWTDARWTTDAAQGDAGSVKGDKSKTVESPGQGLCSF